MLKEDAMLFNNNTDDMFQKDKLENLLKVHNVSRDQVLRDTLGKNPKDFSNWKVKWSRLINKKEEKCDLYPLEVNYCNKCHNCQLSVAVDPKKMFSNYLYTSSTSKVFRTHFVEAAKKYSKELKLSKKIHL